jgi:hydrogenase nickel incorporation protein HypA/HybF
VHEMTIARSVIEIATEAARSRGARRVRSVRCRIGSWRCVEDTLLTAAFEASRAGTACEAARLRVEKRGPRGTCRLCGRRVEAEGLELACPVCGGALDNLEGGDELEVVSIEVEAGSGGQQ